MGIVGSLLLKFYKLSQNNTNSITKKILLHKLTHLPGWKNINLLFVISCLSVQRECLMSVGMFSIKYSS